MLEYEHNFLFLVLRFLIVSETVVVWWHRPLSCSPTPTNPPAVASFAPFFVQPSHLNLLAYFRDLEEWRVK